MSNELSIASSIQENYSDTIITVRNSGNSLNKDLEELQERLNGLNKAKFSLNLDTKAAQRSLKALEDEYIAVRESGGVVSNTLLDNLDQANAAYETTRDNLALVSKKAREAEHSIAQYSSEASKASNKAEGLQGAALKTLASPEILKMGGEMVVNLATTWAGSAGGDEAATLVGSIVSSAVSGAIAGTAINPGVGTVVGTVVGTGIGLVNGLTQNFAEEDDYFKDYRNGLVDRANAGLQGDISAGSGIAAQREMDRLLENMANAGDNVAYLSKSFEELKDNTFLGLSETVALLNQDRQNAYGEGYNAERMKGLEAEKNFMTGDDLEGANEADKAIGAYYASLDNKRDELRRAAEKEAYDIIEAKGYARDGAKAGRILMEARAKAEAQYNASDEAQNELKMQVTMLEDVGLILDKNDAHWRTEYLLSAERSKGMASIDDGISDPLAARDYAGLLTEEEARERYPLMTFKAYQQMRGVDGTENSGYGFDYKNYDDFTDLLRERNQVQMSSDSGENGKSVPVTIAGNTFIVREEADVDKITQEIVQRILHALMLS